jgi:hypothetical protein
MERFLQDQNIVLYRRLRNPSTGETERRRIIELLAGEMAKLRMSEHQPSKSVKRQRWRI